MAKAKTVAALVLPEEAAASSEPQTFGVFPGIYTPGEPVAIETLGLTATEARERVKELGLPLKSARAPTPKEPETAASALEAFVTGEKAPSEELAERMAEEEV